MADALSCRDAGKKSEGRIKGSFLVKKFQNVTDPPIVQYSPPRTGSTLVWNVLRLCFSEKRVKKQHLLTPFQKYRWCPSTFVCSIRNPLDAMASYMNAREIEYSETAVENTLSMYEGCFEQVLKLLTRKNVLILRYEHIYHDFDFLFDQLEMFFGKEIPKDAKSEVILNYSIENVKRIADQLGDFDNFTEENHIHGNHISSHKGATGYFREYFNAAEVSKVYSRLGDIYRAFDYPDPTAEG